MGGSVGRLELRDLLMRGKNAIHGDDLAEFPECEKVMTFGRCPDVHDIPLESRSRPLG
jgi:hypothetical protein